MRMCVNRGLSILFRIYAKPTKHALVIYPKIYLNFFHVGLFLFIFMCMWGVATRSIRFTYLIEAVDIHLTEGGTRHTLIGQQFIF